VEEFLRELEEWQHHSPAQDGFKAPQLGYEDGPSTNDYPWTTETTSANDDWTENITFRNTEGVPVMTLQYAETSSSNLYELNDFEYDQTLNLENTTETIRSIENVQPRIPSGKTGTKKGSNQRCKEYRIRKKEKMTKDDQLLHQLEDRNKMLTKSVDATEEKLLRMKKEYIGMIRSGQITSTPFFRETVSTFI